LDFARVLAEIARFLDARRARYGLKEMADIQFLLGIPGSAFRALTRERSAATSRGRFRSGSMKSKRSPAIEIRTTAADVAALRRASQAAAGSGGDYLAFLLRFPPASTERLRARPGPRGGPFRLE
jgi:hypothetical protein